MKTKLSWSLRLLSAAMVFSGTILRGEVYSDDAALQAATVNGARSRYGFVGRITAQTTAGQIGGSFVLIDPLHALTSAHIVVPSSGATVTSAYGSFGADVVNNPIAAVGISSWTAYPTYRYDRHPFLRALIWP